MTWLLLLVFSEKYPTELVVPAPVPPAPGELGKPDPILLGCLLGMVTAASAAVLIVAVLFWVRLFIPIPPFPVSEGDLGMPPASLELMGTFCLSCCNCCAA